MEPMLQLKFVERADVLKKAVEQWTKKPAVKEQIHGVTLTRIALMLNDDDEGAVKKAKKRRHNKKQPSLPDPLGINLQDRQEHLYEPSALCDFLEKIGDITSEEKSRLLKGLRRSEIPGDRILSSS
jgi:hypothetical protein